VPYPGTIPGAATGGRFICGDCLYLEEHPDAARIERPFTARAKAKQDEGAVRAVSPRKPTRAAQLGVTDADYARMLAAQDGHCALCPSIPKTRRFAVDHDHKTGTVRGLLCHRCNRVMWAGGITSAWCLRAAAYLDNN
jgi:hypothetical protein